MDSIWINGKIWDALPHVQALAVRNGRIQAMGSNSEVLAMAGSQTVVHDADGRLMLPGFNDSHMHLLQGGFYLLGVDLRDARSEEEFVARLREKAANRDVNGWITGGYWDHEKWPSARLPTAALLDAAAPDRPVLVHRLDWHIACANSCALRLAGITRDTIAPQGGAIDKDPLTGEPTGILRDEAQQLVQRVIPEPTREEKITAALAAMQHAAQLGVTSVQGECAESDQMIFSELAADRRLTVRFSAWQPVRHFDSLECLAAMEKIETPFYRLNTAKLFVDGSFGASTALLFDPYDDNSNNHGLAIHEQEELNRLIAGVDALGWQLAVHAIGDRAVDSALSAMAECRRRNGDRPRRHRIEHAQMVREADLARMRDLSMVASVQPSHCIDDLRWIEKRIGRRCSSAYRLNSFLRRRIPVALGTDWTVEPLDPMLTLYAAVTREQPQGGPPGGWQPQERISLTQAIDLYTEGSAFAEMQDSNKGRLKSGYYADFVLCAADFLYRTGRDLLHSQVETTVVDGRVVFDRTGLYR
ncbi:MAG TPA: amidohydrolase [bacterium]|nr:amidohydrolase [bacterium]HPN34786.1 amidohydrolase [bacterium]